MLDRLADAGVDGVLATSGIFDDLVLLGVLDDNGRVMDSTTLPTLLLGGDPTDPDEAFASGEMALGLPSVRGLIVGRTLLYPPDDDVASVVATAVSMVR